jgi:aminopeptidase S
VNCLVTGLSSGGSSGANDVDGGQTSIQSPPIALPAGATLSLRFRFFFAHSNTASGSDFFRVRVVGNNGQPQTVFAQGGAARYRSGTWGTRTVNLSAYAGQTIQLRVEAADANSASLIEAGIDNITITRQ